MLLIMIIFRIDCGSPASFLRIAGGAQVESNKKWPAVALAISDALQCTANIGKFLFVFFFCELLSITSLFVLVAPMWALASYSCIVGKTEFFNARKEDVFWTLRAGSIHVNDSDVQQVSVERIVTYPQVIF